MNEALFYNLINSHESSTLDYKSEQYKLRDSDYPGMPPVEIEKKKSSFVKDIISMANTVRNCTSYIIIGIREDKVTGVKDLLGISQTYDDTEFQSFIKDKVLPVPIFLYYEYEYKGNKYGIFEIPVHKYNKPCRLKLKDNTKQKYGIIEKNELYIRRGSTNTEAVDNEEQLLNDWLRSLKYNYNPILIIKNIFIGIVIIGLLYLSGIVLKDKIFGKKINIKKNYLYSITIIPFQQMGEKGVDYASIVKDYIDNNISKELPGIFNATYNSNYSISPNFTIDSAKYISTESNSKIIITGKYIKQIGHKDQIKLIIYQFSEQKFYEETTVYDTLSVEDFITGKPLTNLEFTILESFAQELFVGGIKLENMNHQKQLKNETDLNTEHQIKYQYFQSLYYFDLILKKFSNRNDIRYDIIGLNNLSLNRINESIYYFNLALKQELPKAHIAEIYTNLGVAYSTALAYSTAINYFNQALNLNKKQKEAISGLAGSYLFNGQYDSSIVFCRQLPSEMKNLDYYRILYIAYELKKNKSASKEIINEVTKINGEYAKQLIAQGDSITLANSLIDKLNKKINSHPTVELYLNRAFNYRYLAYYKGTIEDFGNASKLGSSEKLNAEIALFYYDLGAFQKSIINYHLLLKMGLNKPSYLYDLANAYNQLLYLDSAKYYIDILFPIDSNNINTRELKEAILANQKYFIPLKNEKIEFNNR